MRALVRFSGIGDQKMRSLRAGIASSFALFVVIGCGTPTPAAQDLPVAEAARVKREPAASVWSVAPEELSSGRPVASETLLREEPATSEPVAFIPDLVASQLDGGPYHRVLERGFKRHSERCGVWHDAARTGSVA